MKARADEDCPVCGEADAANYESMNGQFRLWCAMCSHSTAQYTDLDLARREWLASREQAGRG